MVGGRRAESHWPRSRPTSSTPRRCAWPLIEVRCRATKGSDGQWRSSRQWVEEYVQSRYKRRG